MLVISLKPGERVTIGPDVQVWNSEDVQIKLAIQAPKELAILRDTAKKKAKP
jgi:sRNA-binding carbon storage regulator CsrA